MGRIGTAALAAALFAGTLSPAAPAAAEEAPRMAKEELREMLGRDGVVVLDVRVEGSGGTKIPGAVVADPEAVDAWSRRYPKDATIVLYCS